MESLIKIFPHTLYTKTFREVRMGAGKAVEGWTAVVKPEFYSVAGVSKKLCEALRLASHKLPVKLSLNVRNWVVNK